MKKSNNHTFLSSIAKICGIAFFVLISGIAAAQTRGTVTETKDPRIDSAIAKRLALSKLPNNSLAQNTGNGFRVQFFMGSDRAEAYKAQSKFNDLYPDVKTYLMYSDPNFKVKAGDFKTRLEATRLMELLRNQFTSLIVIAEKINLPKTDSND